MRKFSDNLVVTNKKGSGQVSPLLKIEPQFITILTQMARIGEPLTPVKAIALFNDLIDGTPFQANLKAFKRCHTKIIDESELGRVGYEYWTLF